MMSERGMGRGAALAPDVRVIEKKQETSREIKVAAYCRVSTDLEIQQQSLDVQIAAYNRVIREHPGWVLAGIYADKGISGTSVKHREEFLRMIEDAKAGKIQYILAKSISRFSRNTVDALAYVRELKSYGVSVFFEKEKLDTGNAISEFVLSIFAASAQEEIISLSNNMIYQGIALRRETVVNSDYTGTVNYYNKEGERIPVGELAFSVNESGKIADYLDSGEDSFFTNKPHFVSFLLL